MRWLLLALLIVAASAFYERGSSVISLYSSKDLEAIANSKFLWIIELYREGCGYCQMLTPEYEKTAAALEKLVRVAAVDVEKHRDLAGSLQQTYGFEVKGVPTIIVLKPNAAKPGAKKEKIAYNGERTAAAMTGFLRPLMPDYTERVDAKSWDGFAQKSLAKVIVFSEKKSATSLIKALSAKYHDRLRFAVAKDTAMIRQFNESAGLPALFVLREGAATQESVQYHGATTFMSLDFFLMDFAAPKQKGGSKNTPPKSSPSPPPPPKASPPPPAPKAEKKAEPPIDVSNPSKLSVKQLRAALQQHGGECAGCTEKKEFVEALTTVLAATDGAAHSQSGSSGSAPKQEL
eukprot:m.7896 g.7896  ORF g.7896 m.7896 type:complete len:347 (+) comp5116_c0_seq1:101-1141(+)